MSALGCRAPEAAFGRRLVQLLRVLLEYLLGPQQRLWWFLWHVLALDLATEEAGR